MAATFFRSVDQFKQANETVSGDSQVRSYFFW